MNGTVGSIDAKALARVVKATPHLPMLPMQRLSRKELNVADDSLSR